MKTKKMVVALALSALALAGGCVSARNSAVPMAPDVGADVVTRHRYRVTRVYDGETSKASGMRTDFLSRLQPRVFSSGGIPVVLRIALPRMDALILNLFLYNSQAKHVLYIFKWLLKMEF